MYPTFDKNAAQDEPTHFTFTHSLSLSHTHTHTHSEVVFDMLSDTGTKLKADHCQCVFKRKQ